MAKKRAFVKKLMAFTMCMAMMTTSVNVSGMTVMASEAVEESVADENEVSTTETEAVTDEKGVTETTIAEESVTETEIATVEESVKDTEEATVEEKVTETAAVEGTVVETETIVEETVIETETEALTETEITLDMEVNEVSDEGKIVDLGEGNPIPELSEGYTVTFLDEFNGNELDLDKWNREQRAPGWTNQELQEYTNSEDNSYVAGGKLVLQALKTLDENGNDYYTSGKVTTKDKVKFTYGKIEASMRVPSGGQGMWPAFWMMPQNEQFYGTWPKCGEIDIMEVLGHEPEKAYQTLHWGDPHHEKQGTLTLEKGSFADDYHIFAVEWLPGKLIYTIDGKVVNEVDDWYTKMEGGDEATFPAPFDQDFFLQLNLAVGGTWPGNPDKTTVFGEGAQFVVDWVRVSQKSQEDYDKILSELKQPDRTVELREPDANGNYVVNGDFAVAEKLDETDGISAGADWVFLKQQGGEGNASIDTEKKELKITTTNASADEHGQTYSIQLVQPGIPLKQGNVYTLSFEAKSDEARSMIVDMSNTSTWSRYLNDTSLNMTTDWQTYTYEIPVTAPSDANARLEFNLAKQNSVAAVYLRNVSLKQTGTVEIEESATTPDGNYVRNGAFEIGDGRLAYWNVNTGDTGAKVSVTNTRDDKNNIYVRELKTTGAKGVTADQVTVTQHDIAYKAGTTYAFTMDAYAEAETEINVKVAGVNYPVKLTTQKQTLVFDVTTPAELADTSLVLGVGSETTVYVDNISIKDKSLIINGSFDNGLSGWTPYSYLSDVSWEIIKDGTNNAIKYTIPDTGNTDWYIQLKQHNVKLEQGKRYKLTFKVKSDISRDIQFAFQRDGALHKNEDGSEDWTPYSNTEVVTLGGDDKVWETFSTIFEMKEPTDATTIMGITMGAVGGKQVAQKHEIFLDDFVLEETDEEIPKEITPITGEMIKNGDFANGTEGWEGTEIYSPATGWVDFANGKAVYNITSLKDAANWNVQIKQNGLTLIAGKTYKVKFDIKSSADKDVKWTLIDPSNWNWYIGETLTLKQDELKSVEYTYTVDKASSDNIQFQITMSNDDGITVIPAGEHTVEIDNISVMMEGSETEPNPEPNPDPAPEKGEMIVNGDFAQGNNSWTDNCGAEWVPAKATVDYSNNAAEFNITDIGTENWHVQLKQSGLKLVNGYKYKVKFDVKSDVSRFIEFSLQGGEDVGYKVYGNDFVELKAGEDFKSVEYILDMTETTNNNADFTISLGKLADKESASGKVTIKSISVMLDDGTSQEPEDKPDSEVKEGLRIEKIADQSYTGKAIKPTVVVYDGETLLTEKKDYTVSFSNNKNVGKAVVKVKGKGNYEGTLEGTFNIVKKNLRDADITVADVYAVVKNNKVKEPKVVVKMGNTALKENRDYTLVRPEIKKDSKGNIITGEYVIKIEAVEDAENKVCNFTGSRTVKFDVVSNNAVSMNKVTVKVAENKTVSYADYANGTKKPVITVTYGNGANTVDLVKEGFCKVTYPTAEEIAVGKNNVIKVSARIGSGYYGTKTVKFTVTGKKMTAGGFEITGIEDVTYTGNVIEQNITVTDKTNAESYVMVKDTDYKVEYNKAPINQGTVKVTIKGIGAYSGKLTKSFKINKADISKQNLVIASEAAYSKTGAKPSVVIKCGDYELVENKDYTITYKNNKDLGKDTAKVTIKGKGNFTGKIEKNFSVVAASADTVKFTADDVYMKNLTVDKLKAKISVTEAGSNKKLTVNTDYDKTVKYYSDEACTVEVKAEDLVAGKTLYAQVTLTDNYGKATVKDDFRLYTTKASAFNVAKIDDEKYTGKEIKPILDGKVTINGKALVEGEHYSIQYDNNVNVGKGKIIITGLGEYGGTKTVTFKIVKQKMTFAESLKGLLEKVF